MDKVSISVHLLMLAIHLLSVESYTRQYNEYIGRVIDNKLKHCIPYYDCPPGKEILPCIAEYTNDTCVSCKHGYVQPDFITSDKNTTLTTCFKPKGECKPDYEKTPSRTENAEGCSHSAFCKCNIYECYFGNPCACSSRSGCEIGKTMNNIGDCVPCPEGTFKNDTGCGPCKHIPSHLPNVNIQIATEKHQEETGYQSTIPPSQSTRTKDRGDRSEDDKADTMMGLTMALICVLVLLFCLAGWVMYRKKQICRATFSVKHNHSQPPKIPTNGDNGQDLEESLNATENSEIHDGMSNNHHDNQDGNSLLSSSQETSKQNCRILVENVSHEMLKSSTLPNSPSDKQNIWNAASLPVAISNIFNGDESSTIKDKTEGLHEFKQESGAVFKLYRNDPTMLTVNHSDYNNTTKLDFSILNPYPDNYQITEHHSSPVVQETDGIHHNKGSLCSEYSSADRSLSSGYNSADHSSLCSPMSVLAGVKPMQEYEYLVSESDRYTESISSCLECQNYQVIGQMPPSMPSQTTKVKHGMTTSLLDISISSPDSVLC